MITLNVGFAIGLFIGFAVGATVVFVMMVAQIRQYSSKTKETDVKEKKE